MLWVRLAWGISSLVLVLLLLLWALGAFRWLTMVVSFLIRESQGERRELTLLRWKLQALKAVAGAIGRTEARLAEIESVDDG